MTGWTPPPLPAQWSWAADRPPWVGRQREIDQLERVWASVQHGARQTVLVAGEPGAGKSRLVMECASALSDQGVPVLVGQCTSDLGLPFDPLVAPIQALMRSIESGDLNFPQGEDAKESLGLLAQLTAGVVPEGSTVTLPAMAFRAVVSALTSACAAGPLVLVLEDLHWAGDSALRGLRHILERTADLPILVLATHRDRPPDVSDPLVQMTSEVLRLPGSHRMALAGLGTEEVRTYLSRQHAGDPAQIERAAPVLRARTDGNPFLLGEVWRELRRHGGLDQLGPGDLAVPESLQSLVHARLGKLEPAQRRLIERGAVVGETFDLSLVHASGDRHETLEEVFAAATRATDVGLVRAVPDHLGTYVFPHALARQAVLAEMDPYAVASTHAAIAKALESGDLRDPERIRALAHHYSMASGFGLEDRAVLYLARAAEAARSRLAYSDAGGLLERAAELTTDPGERDELRLHAAQSYVLVGRFDRAWPLAEAVATAGEQSLRLEAALCLETISWRNRNGITRAVELLGSALEGALLSGDAPVRIQATAALGRVLASSGRFAEGEELVADALARARVSGDPALLLAVLDIGIVENMGLHLESDVEGLRLKHTRAVEASALARAAGDLDKLGNAAQGEHILAYVLGDVDSWVTSLDTLAQVAQVSQNGFWEYRALVFRASRHLTRGDLVSAADSVREAAQIALSVGHAPEILDGPLSLQTFAHRREDGGLEFARGLLSGPVVPRHPWGPGLVAMYRELDLAEAGLAALRRAVGEELDELRTSETWLASLALLGDAAVWAEDRPSAEVLLGEVAPFSGLNLTAAELLAPFGSADRLIGGLKSVLGDADAEDHFAAALTMDRAMEAPLHVATTHVEWAAHLRRSGARSERIDHHLHLASEIAEAHDLARVRRLVQGDRAARRALPDGLTAREIDVLRLVGLGHSNRAIAAALFISEHTAANHVRSILAKTQAANRTAAAHYAQRHGLLDVSSPDGVHGRS